MWNPFEKMWNPYFVDFVDICGLCGKFHIPQIDSTISTFHKSIPQMSTFHKSIPQFPHLSTFSTFIHKTFLKVFELSFGRKKKKKRHKFYINCCFVKATTLSPVSVLCHVREQEFRQSRELEKTAYVEISKKQWVFLEHPLFFGDFHIRGFC
jgi:hypothetical protein